MKLHSRAPPPARARRFPVLPLIIAVALLEPSILATAYLVVGLLAAIRLVFLFQRALAR